MLLKILKFTRSLFQNWIWCHSICRSVSISTSVDTESARVRATRGIYTCVTSLWIFARSECSLGICDWRPFLTWRPPSRPVMFARINKNAQWLKFTWGFEPHHPPPHAWASILVCTAKSWTDSVRARRFLNLSQFCLWKPLNITECLSPRRDSAQMFSALLYVIVQCLLLDFIPVEKWVTL